MRKFVILFVGVAALMFANSVEALHTGWTADEGAEKLKNPFASDAGAVAEGKKIYEENCAKCHGAEGKGKGASSMSLQIELPDFSDKDMSHAETDGEWFWKIRTGQFEMPPFQLKIKDDEVWKVITYIRTLAK